MPSFAMTVPYLRASPVRIPQRDLVLGRVDSLFLRVTVVDSDTANAGVIDLSGGINAPALRMMVWPDHCCHSSWDYGAWPLCPQSVLWSGTGVISGAIGAFDIAFPTATMASWPLRCAYALQLDYQSPAGSALLVSGKLHVASMPHN
jgi:hypothetical protein